MNTPTAEAGGAPSPRRLRPLDAFDQALVDAARRGLIDNETASAQVNDIDRALMEMMHHAPDPHEH